MSRALAALKTIDPRRSEIGGEGRELSKLSALAIAEQLQETNRLLAIIAESLVKMEKHVS